MMWRSPRCAGFGEHAAVVGGGPVALFGMTVDDRIQVIARAGDLRAVAVDDHAVTVSVGVGVVSVSASSPLNIFWDRIGVRVSR
jgi:hypothetical protein